MAKIRLVIADPDEGYVLGLSDYISSFYSHKFEVYTFTEYEYLLQFLTPKSNCYDMLLISPEFYIDKIRLPEAGIVVLLGPVGLTQNVEGIRIINRYQHAEKLIGNISEVLSENDGPPLPLYGGNKHTRIIGVFSSGGGTGKTTLSLGCSIQAALRGYKVFYLNLETINSIDFLEYDKKKSLSKILFYLKGKNNTLPLKIEGTRCIDAKYGIHYFSPLDSPLDLGDISPEEFRVLISTLRAMSEYDFIFIDLPNVFTCFSTRILDSCDHVVILTEYNATTEYRYNSMVDHMRSISHMFDSNIMEKFIPILNKYDQMLFSGVGDMQRKTDNFLKIPYIPEGRSGGIESCLQSEAFAHGADSVIEYLIQE